MMSRSNWNLARKCSLVCQISPDRGSGARIRSPQTYKWSK